MGILDDANIPTMSLQESRALRAHLLQKGGSEKTRLEAKVEKATDESKAERKWRIAVWDRDEGKCRWCERRVKKTIALDPQRGECHHVSGRTVEAIRWLRANGILLCLACHELLTGKINEKHVLVPTATFSLDGVAYADADKPVEFKRVA